MNILQRIAGAVPLNMTNQSSLFEKIKALCKEILLIFHDLSEAVLDNRKELLQKMEEYVQNFDLIIDNFQKMGDVNHCIAHRKIQLSEIRTK